MTAAVTIVTPTKNRLALLRETMDSVAAQDFADWEHLVVDDGSDDGSIEEVARRAGADPRIRLIRREGPKSGANVCRNLGVAQAQGEFVIFLDSDDLLRRGALKERVAFMRRNTDLSFAVYPAGVFTQKAGDMDRLYHPMTPGDDLVRFLSHECVWEITGPIWRRDYLLQIGGLDESLFSMQDLEMHVRAICGGGHYLFVPGPDHDIRWQFDLTKTSARHFRDPQFIQASMAIAEKLFETVRGAGLMTWSRRRAVGGLVFSIAQNWVRAGRLGDARRAWASGSRRVAIPGHIRLAGTVMLFLSSLSGNESSLPARIVNKWKGLVRFRQEPAVAVAGSPQ